MTDAGQPVAPGHARAPLPAASGSFSESGQAGSALPKPAAESSGAGTGGLLRYRNGSALTDVEVVLLAASVWLGAWIAGPGPNGLALAAVGTLAVVTGRNRRSRRGLFLALVLLGLALIANSRAQQSWAGLLPSEVGAAAGSAVLVSDPVAMPGGIRVQISLNGDRLDAQAWGSAAGQLRNRLMGEVIDVSGTVNEVPASTWNASRGIVGRITVTDAARWRTGEPFSRVANSVRRTIESGASSLSRDQRALLTGLVYGDDRNQSPLTDDDFQAAGLTHLLAVSGQNVAFVLVIAGPLLRRLGYRGRFAVTLVILMAFATLTRFEPSVLRASVMAGVAGLAVVLGRPASSIRIIAMAVAGLILWSPLIVHAVAFQLSVAASAGILLITPWLTPLIRGPRMFAEAVGVTAGAQLAVSPLLVLLFGSVPVASLPANVLAGPAAGPAMMWGLTGGWAAGIVGEPWASWIHLPTRLFIGWIEGVARLSAAARLGVLSAVPIVLLAVTVAWVVWSPIARRRRFGLALVSVLLLVPAVLGAARAPTTVAIDQDSTLWRDGHVAVLELHASTRIDDVLEGLRLAGVRDLDLVIVDRGGYGMHTTLGLLRDRYEIGAVWAPPGHGLAGVHSVVSAQRVEVGSLIVTVSVDDDGPTSRLVVSGQR